MKEKIKNITNHHHTRTTVKYGIVSVIATIIDFVVLNGGIKLFELAPQMAKTLAFATATVGVFRLQQRWVFRADPETSTKKQIFQYLAASIAGFLASQGAITVSNALWPGNLLYINVANFMGFGSVWLAKLVFFRFVVFKPPLRPGEQDFQEADPGAGEAREEAPPVLSKGRAAGSEAVA